MLKPFRLVIVDDNPHFRSILCDFFQSQPDITIVGTASNGLDALPLIQKEKPDLVILDIVMPHLDGLGVLEKMADVPLSERPLFVVLSAFNQEALTRRAGALGAHYFIAKPFDVPTLGERVRQILRRDFAPATAQSDAAASITSQTPASSFPSSSSLTPAASPATSSVTTTTLPPPDRLDIQATDMIRLIGIPTHIKGYQFLRNAIILAVQQPKLLDAVTKALYPRIAEHHHTTPVRVERAIRHAIELAWTRGDTQKISHILGQPMDAGRGKPTNAEFIAMVAETIRLQRT
ncbi:sporulation transcription factor Spo0A [Heliophilum fasciatum]|uniref:Stage 0 sporulation protein A homolog n=1 Tax=Heliophilum fasciatum TaxID=35700 RepID=A0A4R2RRA0_9FIRM|nr:sporulation transcription factor Spo0A [Heliophilum fasciatum]MCW2277619.1 two-component system response regulator (stage 0 sporulation protein A) [Heliophilum fasciatum]TCP64967.1 two-component system response regulator (stage 0 sporulation protein A) [Heliophilum fasciatum]